MRIVNIITLYRAKLPVGPTLLIAKARSSHPNGHARPGTFRQGVAMTRAKSPRTVAAATARAHLVRTATSPRYEVNLDSTAVRTMAALLAHWNRQRSGAGLVHVPQLPTAPP
jgi:hypothetical protein